MAKKNGGQPSDEELTPEQLEKLKKKVKEELEKQRKEGKYPPKKPDDKKENES